jgi:hypothetical protein
VVLVLAEQHDLCAVILAAQEPRLVLLVERAPVVGVAVLPALRFESAAAVGVALEAHQRALPFVPGAVSSMCGLREPAATFAPTPKLPRADCSRPVEASSLM